MSSWPKSDPRRWLWQARCASSERRAGRSRSYDWMVAHPSITQGVQCQQETIYYRSLTADADLRRPTLGDVNEVVDSTAEDAVHQRVGALEHRPNHAHQSVSNNRKPRSRQLYQAIAKILVLVRRLWASFAVDEVPGGNHRRGRADATSSGSGWDRATLTTSAPGHPGNVGTAHMPRLFASERLSPRVPAPAAPQLPAQYAIRRDTSDESALSPRRSTPPANPAPR